MSKMDIDVAERAVEALAAMDGDYDYSKRIAEDVESGHVDLFDIHNTLTSALTHHMQAGDSAAGSVAVLKRVLVDVEGSMDPVSLRNHIHQTVFAESLNVSQMMGRIARGGISAEESELCRLSLTRINDLIFDAPYITRGVVAEMRQMAMKCAGIESGYQKQLQRYVVLLDGVLERDGTLGAY